MTPPVTTSNTLVTVVATVYDCVVVGTREQVKHVSVTDVSIVGTVVVIPSVVTGQVVIVLVTM